MKYANENHGIAALTPLDKTQLLKQSEILENAPKESDNLTIHKARFKANLLEVLVSMSVEDKDNSKPRIWIPADMYPCFGERN